MTVHLLVINLLVFPSRDIVSAHTEIHYPERWYHAVLFKALLSVCFDKSGQDVHEKKEELANNSLDNNITSL